MSQDGFPNEDGEQMTPELLLLQERQRASEWPKVPVSYLHTQSQKQLQEMVLLLWFLICLVLPMFI